jgi:hypothetical protein
MDIGNYTNDSPSPVLRHRLSDRVLPGPQSASQSLIHHHHRFTRRSIALREFSPRLQRDSQGLEVSIAHDANKCLWMMALFVNLPFTRDLPTPIPVERQDIAYPGCCDAGD